MRSILLVATLLLALPLAGCFSQDGSESTAPPDQTASTGTGAQDTPLGHTSTGCTGNESVGAGNGDIGSDHQCGATTAPSFNASG